MISTKLLIFSAALLFLYVLWKRRRFYLLMFKIPGPWGYPLFGISLELRKREEFFKIMERYEKDQNYFLSWVGPVPFLVVADAQVAQDLLTSTHCVNRGIFVDMVSKLIGLGLLTVKDPEWSRNRKLLNPAFNNKVLINFFPIFNDEANKLLSTLNDLCGTGDFDISEVLKVSTYRLTTRTLMDRNVSTEKINNDNDLVKAYDYFLDYILKVSLSPWNLDSIFKLFHIYPKITESLQKVTNFTTDLITKKMASREALQSEDPKPNEGQNLINLSLKLLDRGDFTYQNVKDEANGIIGAGFETSNNTLAHALIVIAMFPEYQEKLFEELVNLYPDPENFEITSSDIQEMVYLDMVINEVMRIMPAVPIFIRELTADVKLSNGITLPKGLQIAIDIFNLQRRKDIWGPEARSFNPDNFLPSNLEGKHSYAFIPFAKGARNCIGWRYALLSMKVVLAKLIRNYKFETDFKFDDLVFVEQISLRLEVIPNVKISRREH